MVVRTGGVRDSPPICSETLSAHLWWRSSGRGRNKGSSKACVPNLIFVPQTLGGGGRAGLDIVPALSYPLVVFKSLLYLTLWSSPFTEELLLIPPPQRLRRWPPGFYTPRGQGRYGRLAALGFPPSWDPVDISPPITHGAGGGGEGEPGAMSRTAFIFRILKSLAKELSCWLHLIFPLHNVAFYNTCGERFIWGA